MSVTIENAAGSGGLGGLGGVYAAPAKGTAPPVFLSGADRWQDWFLLLKPRVVSLVVFTGFIGLFMAPGHLHPVLAFTAVLCIAVAAGAAGALNMWYERDIDALMQRTRRRPIPAGRVEPGSALAYGVALSVASVLVMGLATNICAATVLAVSIAFYVLVYTVWLKRRTPQNIVIGGAAGAFPPLIGWAAVTGSVDVLPLLLFGIVFFWTPPHFWALSLYACKDYGRAGVPMLPVVCGARETRRQIFGYTLLLAVVSVLPWILGYTGAVYGCAASVLGAGFILCAWRVLRDQGDATGTSRDGDMAARLTFRYSLLYLAGIFLALAADKILVL
jgi:protoheme IX farnesyltransferase